MKMDGFPTAKVNSLVDKIKDTSAQIICVTLFWGVNRLDVWNSIM